MDKLLGYLENNGRLTFDELAAMCDMSAAEVKAATEKYENDGVILGYQALVDWDKTDREYVSAIIELKITPGRECGFDRLAEKISNYPEVKSVCLMSGGFDLMLMLEGKTMREVAYFVAYKLAPLEGVVSTATHFVLKKYKDKGVVYKTPDIDEREFIM